jgi:hypothetical protein
MLIFQQENAQVIERALRFGLQLQRVLQRRLGGLAVARVQCAHAEIKERLRRWRVQLRHMLEELPRFDVFPLAQESTPCRSCASQLTASAKQKLSASQKIAILTERSRGP